jgi:argininosuccinate lyase
MIRDRFEAAPDPFVQAFTDCTADDAELVQQDIDGSIAHARMLAQAGLLTAAEADALVTGLEAQRGITLDPKLEDVHMNVEARLGEPGKKLHTARSRNDQVALDLRLWTRGAIDRIVEAIGGLRDALAARERAILPGVTHLQRAQPVTLRHVLMGYHAALGRDAARLTDARARANVSPLGAGALAGSTLPIDPAFVAQQLGFAATFANSIDAVGDRDFAAEFVGACALTMVHLSQLAETLILWTTPEFDFIELPDALCTGSSMMPQKKNPDILELVRGKAGSVAAAWVDLVMTLKGLPPGYNRDLQQTKAPVFGAARTTLDSITACRLAVAGMKVHAERMRAAAADERLLATDVAEHLVLQGVPFREAYARVAQWVRAGEKFSDHVDPAVLDPEASVQKRNLQ